MVLLLVPKSGQENSVLLLPLGFIFLLCWMSDVILTNRKVVDDFYTLISNGILSF